MRKKLTEQILKKTHNIYKATISARNSKDEFCTSPVFDRHDSFKFKNGAVYTG